MTSGISSPSYGSALCPTGATGGGPALRVRRVFSTPREIYRLEIEEMGGRYLRTTLLDRDALEDLLETDGVRERILKEAGP